MIIYSFLISGMSVKRWLLGCLCGLIVGSLGIPLLGIWMRILNFKKPFVSLSDIQKEALKPYFDSSIIQKARICYSASFPYIPSFFLKLFEKIFEKKKLLQDSKEELEEESCLIDFHDTLGLTFGNIIYLRMKSGWCIEEEEDEEEEEVVMFEELTTIAHEMVHVSQYNSYLIEPLFGFKYTYDWATCANFDYYEIQFEKEAFDLESEIEHSLMVFCEQTIQNNKVK